MEHGRPKVRGVGIDEEATFLCVRCDHPVSKCFVCHYDQLPKEDAALPAPNEKKQDDESNHANTQGEGDEGDVMGKVEDMLREIEPGEAVKDNNEAKGEEEEEEPIRFRCIRCKQEAHYEHRE